MKSTYESFSRPFYSSLVIYAFLMVWSLKLLKKEKSDAFLAGVMMCLLEFPLEWFNEKTGPLWETHAKDTNRQLRDGFPSEAPLGFFFGATVICLLTENRSTQFFRKWLPAVLSGIGGALGEGLLCRWGKLHWNPPWGAKGVFSLYSLGVFGILSFRDQTRQSQLIFLLILLLASGVTFPKSALSD